MNGKQRQDLGKRKRACCRALQCAAVIPVLNAELWRPYQKKHVRDYVGHDGGVEFADAVVLPDQRKRSGLSFFSF
jgi:hypothetical protein